MAKRGSFSAILCEICGVVIIVAFILFLVMVVRTCGDAMHTQQMVYQSQYTATYGSFLSGYTVYHFDTYTSEGNHYTFYDTYGNITGDVFVIGNNVFFITGGTQ